MRNVCYKKIHNFILSEKEMKIIFVENKTNQFHWKLILFPKPFGYFSSKKKIPTNLMSVVLYHGIYIEDRFLQINDLEYTGFLSTNFLNVELDLNISREKLRVSIKNDSIIIRLLNDIFKRLNCEKLLSINLISNFIQTSQIESRLTPEGRKQLLKSIRNSVYYQNTRISFYYNGKEIEDSISNFLRLKYTSIIFFDKSETDEIPFLPKKVMNEISRVIFRRNPIILENRNIISIFNQRESEYNILLYLLYSPNKKIISLDVNKLFFICEKVNSDNIEPAIKKVFQIASYSDIPCFKFIFNFAIIIRINRSYKKKENKFEEYSISKNCWNLNHPFFRSLMNLDSKIQDQILEDLVIITKILKLYTDIPVSSFSDDLECFYRMYHFINTIDSLKKYREMIFGNDLSFIQFQKMNPFKANFIDLFQSEIISEPDALIERY